jgi:UDP-glucuronate decarboxylase
MIQEECSKIVNLINFEELNNKSVLVTGASGLIGIYMLTCLKEARRKFNIKIYAWIKNDIDPIYKNIFENCEIIKHDITDHNIYEKIPTFDYIIHSAGYGQPNRFLDDKIKTIMLNTTSTVNLLNKLNSGGKFLFVSTSELYSGLDIDLITENDIGTTNTNHPRSCYIDGKRCGESICYSYLEKGINVKIVRLSLAYGPGTKAKDTRVLNSLIEKGLTSDTIKLADDGSAIRTYCYITDIVEMFWNVLFFGKHELYNIGGTSKTNILELANQIGKILNKKVVTSEQINTLKGSPKLVNLNLDRYIKEFNKNKFVTLEEGLIKTIEWQKQIYIK